MPKYIDINSSYKLSNTESSAIVTDIKSICKDLERLFNTPKGSVPFNRAYGTSLRNLLFENNLNPADVVVFLYQDITTFEPRVELNPSDIEIIQTDKNTYTVNCKFTVPSFNFKPGMASVILRDTPQTSKEEAFLNDSSAIKDNIYTKDKVYNSLDYKHTYGK